LPWLVKEEHPDGFVIHGNAGIPFKIKKGNLSAPRIAEMSKMAKGGVVKPQKLADGDVVEDQPPTADVPWISGRDRSADAPPGMDIDPRASAPGAPGDIPGTFIGPNGGLVNKDGILVDPGSGGDEPAKPGGGSMAASTPAPGGIAPTQNGPLDDLLARNRAAASPSAPAPQDQTPTQTDQQQASAQAGAQSSSGMSWPSIPSLDLSPVQKLADESLAAGKAGAEQQAKAEGDAGTNLAKAWQAQQTQLAQMQSEWKTKRDAAASDVDNMVKALSDPKNQIQPNQFWDSKGTFDKFRAGLGLVLSGIGSGLSGQPNMAAQFIQNGIERNIDAQKANLHTKETQLGWAFKKIGNIDDAANMARANAMAATAAEMGKINATAMGPLALAKQQQAISGLTNTAAQLRAGIIDKQYSAAMNRSQMMFQRSMMQQYGAGASLPGYIPSSTPPPSLPSADLEGVSKFHKAVGEQTVNLPGGLRTWAPAEVAPKVNDEIQQFGVMKQQLAKMEQIGRAHPWNLRQPFTTSEQVDYDTAANALQLSMGQLLGLNRFTPEENKSYKVLTGDKSQWSWGQTGQQNVNSMKQLIQQHMNGIYQKLGVRLPQVQAQPRAPGQ
jgi:hypothetical protein